MGSQNGDDQLSPTPEYPKKSKITYSREILLSLSELEICSKLPSGFESFDPSILSEFEDTSSSLPERSRIPGSLSSQNFRRGEYGPSPPARGDASNYSRGIHGRWDSRSSGSTDRDSDSQLDLEPDVGRRYGNPRRSGQTLEHDGLLGSGSTQKPPGYASASVTKVRGGDQYQLKKTYEPYQPPRPYKAAPHSRRDATDIINEETFGSSESSSQDRAEEEKKRRASFEQFRKEQKSIQENQKQFPDKHKEHADPDMAALLANSEDDKKRWDKNIGFEIKAPTVLGEEFSQSSFTAQTHASRPLVPPGFTGTTMEKNLATKSFISHSTVEVGNGGVDENIAQIEGNVVANGNSLDEKSSLHVDSSEKQFVIKTIHTPFTDISEKSKDRAKNENFVGVVSPSYANSNLPEMHVIQGNNESADFYGEKLPGSGVMGSDSQEHSTSLLTKLFSKSSIVESGVSSFSEPGDVNADARSPVSYQSSKFTHWFHEEEKRPSDELSSGKPESLLSLIVNGEQDGLQMSRASDMKQSVLPLGSNDLINKSGTASSAIATFEPSYHSNNSGGSQGVLTCEDLEQAILSEFSDNSSSLDHSFQARNVLDTNAGKRPEVDNHASQHLLSLLQKGTSAKDSVQSHVHEPLEDFSGYKASSVNSVHKPSVGDSENATKSEKNLTLETLFGSAFMNELQSVKAPVSVQRGSVDGVTQTAVLDSHGFPVPDDGFSPFMSRNSTLENDTHVSNQMQQRNSNNNVEAWLGFDASQSKMRSDLSTRTAINRPEEPLEVQLPDEDSLITLTDPAGNASEADFLYSSSKPVNIVDKLAALNAVFRKERSSPSGSDDPSFLRGSYNPAELELQYQNQHERPTSQFAHLQMNQGRTMFQPSDSHPSHMNPALQFRGSENVIHPDFQQHRFSPNTFNPSGFQHLSNGPTRFSPPAHHPMLQQMHMQGNMIPPHLQRGPPRGAPMPTYGINHMTGYAPEPNPMQNLPFGRRQPNYGSLELPMQAQGVGSGGNNHPNALEQFFEMELRANLKHMHPGAGPAPGHGIDMGFRYR